MFIEFWYVVPIVLVNEAVRHVDERLNSAVGPPRKHIAVFIELPTCIVSIFFNATFCRANPYYHPS